jgi:modification methylase
MTGTPTTEVPHPGPSLWTLRQHRPGRHHTTRAVTAYAVDAYTRPGDTVIILPPPDTVLGRTVLEEVIRSGRQPIIPTGDPTDASRDLQRATPAGAGVLLLTVLVHPHPEASSRIQGAAPIVSDSWVQAMRQALLDCRWLLRPAAHVVAVSRPTRHHGQLLDLPGAMITAGRTAGLLPIQRCAAVTLSARGHPLPARISRAEHRAAERGQRLTSHPTSRVAHHDILIFQTPAAALTQATVRAPTPNLTGPTRPQRSPGTPFEYPTLERPAA